MPRDDKAAPDVNALFEGELTRREVRWTRDTADDYRVSIGDGELQISLVNLRRNALRDADPRAVTRFVDHVLGVASFQAPDWSEASRFLLLSAEAADNDFGDTIRTTVSDELVCVLTLTDAEHSRVTWVSAGMCERWGVTPDAAIATARRNQDGLFVGRTVEIADGGGDRLGMIPVHAPYKASTIFAPAFKQFVAPLGWPVLVVIPCRDFMYVVADGSPLVGKLGSVVVKEYRASGYPITTEVFRISDEGIQAIGRFPV
jgi:hypothetical protein